MVTDQASSTHIPRAPEGRRTYEPRTKCDGEGDTRLMSHHETRDTRTAGRSQRLSMYRVSCIVRCTCTMRVCRKGSICVPKGNLIAVLRRTSPHTSYRRAACCTLHTPCSHIPGRVCATHVLCGCWVLWRPPEGKHRGSSCVFWLRAECVKCVWALQQSVTPQSSVAVPIPQQFLHSRTTAVVLFTYRFS